MYTLDANGKRVYTLKKVVDGRITNSAHPARFSPDDTYSRCALPNGPSTCRYSRRCVRQRRESKILFGILNRLRACGSNGWGNRKEKKLTGMQAPCDDQEEAQLAAVPGWRCCEYVTPLETRKNLWMMLTACREEDCGEVLRWLRMSG